MAQLFHLSGQTLVDGNGAPYAAAKAYFYETGTTTPKTTYSNAGLSSSNTNPVVADADGRFGDIYLIAGRYKVVYATSADVAIDTLDPVDGTSQLITAASAPATTYPFLRYYNTTDGNVYRRNAANSAWINEGPVDAIGNAATVSEVLTGTSTSVVVTPDALAGIWQRGADITAASTLSLPAGGGYDFNVTGTTTITGISSAQGGRKVRLKFASSLTLTHNASSFVMPGATSVAVSPGDMAEFTNEAAQDASGSSWRMSGYFPNLQPLTPTAISPALPGATNLLIVNGGATTNVTITFDQAVLVNSAGYGMSVLSGSYTCDCSVNGALNRLDTGSLANSSEYHIWLIAKPDGTLPGALMSLSATSPTLPSGYSGGFKARVGCFITGGSATFLRLRQIGNHTRYVVAAGTTTTTLPTFTVATNASKTALTAAGTVGAGGAAQVPSTARSIFVICSQNGSTSASAFVFPNNDAGYTTGIGKHTGGVTGTGTSGEGGCMSEIMLESASIYYISGNNGAGANADIAVYGWVDRVSAS
jgi:hypothetical protein